MLETYKSENPSSGAIIMLFTEGTVLGPKSILGLYFNAR